MNMIIRENQDHFVLITQHDHGQISGVLSRYWKEEYFSGMDRYEDVIFAINEHDRSWIGLDDTPFWNDREQTPYSFVDFPLIPKLVFYKLGVEEIEQRNPYAALLCSLHYSSFFQDRKEKASLDYLDDEWLRQKSLIRQLNLNENDIQGQMKFHFQLLQFCDNLSLYLCLNEPGVAKRNEHLWFRQGFPKSEQFGFTNGKQIKASWLDDKHVSVSPFPFKHQFQVMLKIKKY
jgi:hypothetical protein